VNGKAAQLLSICAWLPKGAVVVEIGCMRYPNEIASEGYSTFYLAQECEKRGFEFHSVDNNQEAISLATTHVPSKFRSHLADGEEWLRAFTKPIDFLYLDGALDPEQTERQFTAATLAPGAVVAIDDVQNERSLRQGKGTALLPRLEREGWQVTVVPTVNGYEMAFAVAA
jgi:predicted O-methyltransferase YrrM